MSLSEPGTPKKPSRSPAPDRRSLGAASVGKKKKLRDPSESDSDETESAESEQSRGRGSRRRPKGEWEIVEGLREGQQCPQKPDSFRGYLHKRRKWPMKGWHKRFFLLEKGILTYAKSPTDIAKGKIHGSVDLCLSVLTYKKDRMRIDIDADDVIYHLKIKVRAQFGDWLEQLKHHRLYRQHEFSYGTREAPRLTDVATPVDELTPLTVASGGTLDVGRPGSFRAANLKSRSLSLLERSQSKVASWLMDNAGFEQCTKDLTSAQAKVFELSNVLEKLESYAAANQILEKRRSSLIQPLHRMSSLCYDSSSPEERSGSALGLRKAFKKGHRKCSSHGRVLPPQTAGHGAGTKLAVPEKLHGSTSNPNLQAMNVKTRPSSLQDNLLQQSNAQEGKLRSEFLGTAKEVHEAMKTLVRTVSNERERLKHVLEQEGTVGNVALVQQLKQALNESRKQNEELKARLVRIHTDSDIGSVSSTLSPEKEAVSRKHTLTAASSIDSASVCDFYDATEYPVSSGVSSDEDEDASSDISESENTTAPSLETSNALQLQCGTGRRTRLPTPRPDTGDVSLWGLLCRNIGKDLSKISMPVTLNEPLSMLQRLCEELEYSELLDKAAETDDPYERMVLVAAFSVSTYAASFYRAGQKPFNPLLGETYECIREDKGWRFVAEQVAHHPPISACHCESKNFLFWQDIRIKTKFWGKSMEISPQGTVNLVLPKYKDHYTWNKVTTCVHNLFGGQRWVDHYGEVVIRNGAISCRLSYAKSSYWSDQRHEVYGSVFNQEGGVVHHLFGKPNEGMYCGHSPSAKCIWRPGSMPDDYELYYGFSRFAIELNEIGEDQVHLYPPTDCRFRPDQRALEEGRIQEAESEKQRLEQQQRERRKKREEEKVTYSPRWFMRTEDNKGKDVYVYTAKYWDFRKDPGFMKMTFTKLW